jgi:hypothetical protein
MNTKKTPLKTRGSNVLNIEVGQPMNDVKWCKHGELESLLALIRGVFRESTIWIWGLHASLGITLSSSNVAIPTLDVNGYFFETYIDIDIHWYISHIYIHAYMCHCQNMDYFPILGDGHQLINRELNTHYKNSQYGMDDHRPNIQFLKPYCCPP